MKLLVIDDDTRFTNNLYYLFKSFYTVHVANVAKTALQKLTDQRYDLILLDLDLPDVHGLELYKWIRAQHANTPVMVVSGNTSLTTKVELLETGVSDYITKPVHAEELRARIAIHVKRPAPTPAVGTMRYADLVLDTSTRQALHHGEPLFLRSKEYALLECFLLNANQVVSKEILAQYVWDDESTATNNIHVHINRLRSKLRNCRLRIKTMHGKGYRLTRE